MKIIKKIVVFFVLLIISTSYTNATSLPEYYTNRLSDLWIIVKRDNLADYNLQNNVLRQEIAAVALWLANAEKKSNCENIFKDVSWTIPNNWACYTVEALLDKWLIAKNDNFRPEDNISKAEAIWMIVNSIYWSEYQYDSTKWNSWQEQVVNFAVDKWIVDNFSDYDIPATRGFVFEVAANALDIRDGKSIFISDGITPEECFKFDKNTKTITAYNIELCWSDVKIPSTIWWVTVK